MNGSKKKNSAYQKNKSNIICFALYAVFLFMITLGCRVPAENVRIHWSVNWKVDIENIVLFVPFGLLIKRGTKRTVIQMLLLSIFLSTGIEILQLITKLGYCELMDIVNNTIGAYLGWHIQMLYVWLKGEKQCSQ